MKHNQKPAAVTVGRMLIKNDLCCVYAQRYTYVEGGVHLGGFMPSCVCYWLRRERGDFACLFHLYHLVCVAFN